MKIEVDIHILVNDEWTFFVVRELKNLPNKGSIIPITYNDELKYYEVDHVMITAKSIILHVKEDTTKPAQQVESINEQGIIAKFINLFRRNKR